MQSENRSHSTTTQYAKYFLNASRRRGETRRGTGTAVAMLPAGTCWRTASRWFKLVETSRFDCISGKAGMPRTPKDLANRMAARREPTDGFRRQTFALPLEEARARARSILKRYPKAAYMTEVESWRDLGDGRIEFTMKRLPTAD
jgi:hypothetical protein